MLRALLVVSSFVAAASAQTFFPPPPAPVGNAPTPEKVLLGMALFFEEQLSSTSAVACATCHDFAAGGVDARTASTVNPGPDGLFGTADDQRGSFGTPRMGANGAMVADSVRGLAPRATTRRSLTVFNTGYHPRLGYDGSKLTLEAAVGAPILHEREMAHTGRTWADVVLQVQAARPLLLATQLPPRLAAFVGNRSYPQLFAAAFGAGAVVSQDTITKALASYLRTLNTDQTKWDRHLNGAYQLTEEEALGVTLFNSPANGATSCRTCHSDFEPRVLQEGPVIGQMTMVTQGYYGSPVPTRLLFHNVGVRSVSEDPGVQLVTGFPSDAGRFRVASLRNVELSAPYFHNGGAATLRDVIDFYDRGGDFHVNQAPSLTPRNYSITQKDALVAALRLLTDPRVGSGQVPFDRPVLGSEYLRLPTPIGLGAPTTAGRLVAAAPFAARVGESLFRVTLTGATPGAPLLLLWDNLAVSVTGPFGLELAGSPAAVAFAAGVAQSGPGVTRGFKVQPVPIPAEPALAGQSLLAQWLSVEPALQWPLATSNALHVPIW